MTGERLEALLQVLPSLHVVVVGDFFLDEYLEIDAEKDELSKETGLVAYQVVTVRPQPGAAGTVVNNLRALGVGRVTTLGVIGDDGRGWELSRGLQAVGADVTELIHSEERVTPTYTKPMRHEGDCVRELHRLDIKNWSPTPQSLQNRIIAALERLAPQVDAIIVGDQVEEADVGVVTGRVRQCLSKIGWDAQNAPIFVDSRQNIRLFRHCYCKPNEHEAMAAIGVDGGDGVDVLAHVGREIYAQTKRPVFITRGDKGQLVVDGDASYEVRTIPVSGPIDIVGAGDSTMAGIVSAFCAGFSLEESAWFGNLVAAITVSKLGTTGTASPDELCQKLASIET